MPNVLVLSGIVLLFIAIILIIFGTISRGEIKWAVGGFIGPIPFGFGNDPRLLWAVILISVMLLLIFILPLFKQLI
ncbi:MAG: DUF131 domain-containing protein [Candidatus Aenigmatarchaeota archaeon]